MFASAHSGAQSVGTIMWLGSQIGSRSRITWTRCVAPVRGTSLGSVLAKQPTAPGGTIAESVEKLSKEQQQQQKVQRRQRQEQR